ncbi:MAG: alanine racemase [Candidatus Omnitrophica bacterium]|nr:alanine racemase [Candidatus Omnitrophota bacterium]
MKKLHHSSAWVEIDVKAFRHNFREAKRLSRLLLEPVFNRQVDILSVVKADSYGHGMLAAVKAIAAEGGKFFAVSNINEASHLRAGGCRDRILIFEATFPEAAREMVRLDLTPALCTLDMARALNIEAKKAKKLIPVHIKVDTGMSRLGVWYADLLPFVSTLLKLDHIYIEGFLTHYPVADSDRRFTNLQSDVFSNTIADLIKESVPFKYIHAANSMGLAGYKNRYFNLVRPGVMLYGLYPDKSLLGKIDLKPVMSVKTRVLMVKTIHRGRGISYGHTVRASKDTPVAILAIGYSDGYFRSLSNKAEVLLNGVRCRVLGRVTMDQIIVDISRAGRVKIGDTAVLLGKQKNGVITAEEVAFWAGTINYEVTCNLGNRLKRVLV